MIDGIDEGLIKRMRALEEEVKGLKRMPLPARYVINVRDYGATGDGTTDDTAAIQAALDEVASFGTSTNIYIHIYFPAGLYKCDTSLDITNRRYFILRGDGWGASRIVSHASGKPALDLLGARFFDIRDLTISGDSTNTPSVAMYFGRTATGPNCGNCFIDNIALDGKFTKAGIYNLRGEVFVIRGLRSGPNDLDASYVYYVSDANDLSVTSDYDTFDNTYAGNSQQWLSDWWVNTKSGGSYAGSGCYFGTQSHVTNIKNLYFNLYGGTGYALTFKGNITGLEVDQVSAEGTFAGHLLLDAATITDYSFRHIKLTGFSSTNSSVLDRGVFEECTGLASAATWTLETINYSVLRSWWGVSNNNLTITSATGCYIEYPGGGTVTISTDNGNVRQQVTASPYPFRVPALNVAGGSNLTKFLKATASVDFASISAGAEGNATVSLTGAAYGDLALASPRSGLSAGLVIKQVVAETNLVRIYLYNYSGGAIDEAAQNWTVAVIG